MSGLLRLASCSAFSPAAALRGGPAARSVPGTPPLALLLSGGLHLLALALFLSAAGRSVLEEPLGPEIKISLAPGLIIDPPPRYEPPDAGGGTIDPRGRIEPTDSDERPLAENLDKLLRGIVPGDGVRPEKTAAEEGNGGGSGPPPTETRVVVDRETPTDAYDQPPVTIAAPEPPYPDIARDAGIEGRVILEALVSWEGHVRDVRIKEGNPILAVPAAKTVKTWRFRPARWRGEPVSAWVAIPIVFRLR